jgi:MFS family permease
MPLCYHAPVPLFRSSRVREWTELDRRVWRMAAARAINTAGMSLVMAFLGVYVVEERGYPAWLYGLCALGANLAQSMTSAWAGEVSDRIGRRPLLVGSLVLRAAVIAGLGLQILLAAPLWTLALNFVASSALRGCFEPVAYALVADVVRPDQRIAAFGLQRMGTNLGWALGPAVGGLLTWVLPYGVVFFIAALGLAGAAWTVAGVAESRAAAPRTPRVRLLAALRAAAAEPPVLALLVATFLASLVQTQMFSTFSIYLAEELGLAKVEIGLLYTVNGAAVLFLQLPAIRLIRRLGLGRALVGAALLMAVGYAAVGAAVGLASGALVILLITCAEVVFAPAHQTAVAETGDPQTRGRTFGLVAFAQILGVAGAPLLGGTLFDLIGHRHLLLWGVIGGLGLAQAAALAVFVRLHRRQMR